MIDRTAPLRQILDGFPVHPIVALTGPRQCGKKILAKAFSRQFENLKKRQVKSSKVYILDSGILHSLLELPSEDGIVSHQKVGASTALPISQIHQIDAQMESLSDGH